MKQQLNSAIYQKSLKYSLNNTWVCEDLLMQNIAAFTQVETINLSYTKILLIFRTSAIWNLFFCETLLKPSSNQDGIIFTCTSY